MDLSLFLLVAAFVLFIVAAIPFPSFPYSGLVAAGLACLTASMIF